jgi:hypothetical protein
MSIEIQPTRHSPSTCHAALPALGVFAQHQVPSLVSLVAQSTPTVDPDAEADTGADAGADGAAAGADAGADAGGINLKLMPTNQPLWFSIYVACSDLIAEELFYHDLSPFLDMEEPETWEMMVQELVDEVHNRYVTSQQGLPVEEQRMLEAGKPWYAMLLESLLIVSFRCHHRANHRLGTVVLCYLSCTEEMSGRCQSASGP